MREQGSGRSWPSCWFPLRLCVWIFMGTCWKASSPVLIPEPMHQYLWGCCNLVVWTSNSDVWVYLSITGLDYSCFPIVTSSSQLGLPCRSSRAVQIWDAQGDLAENFPPSFWRAGSTCIISTLPHTASKTPVEIVWYESMKERKNMKGSCHPPF